MVSMAKKAKLAFPSGIFPFFKDRGVSCFDLKKWVKLTLQFEEPKLRDGYYSIELAPKNAEWYTTGVFAVGLGPHARRLAAYRRYFTLDFIVTAILGKQTIDDYSDSPLLSQSEYGHISPDAVRNAISKFVGQNILQNYTPPLHSPQSWGRQLYQDLKLSENFGLTDSESVPVDEKAPISPLNTGDMDDEESTEDEQESAAWAINNNSPGSHPSQHIAHCHSIELLQMDGATLRMHVSCDGRFSCRAFVRDLGLRLGCHAALESLHLAQVGPLTTGQALPKHELHLPQIRQSLLSHTPACDEFLRELKTLYPGTKDTYRFI